jgi:hypothetical protein
MTDDKTMLRITTDILAQQAMTGPIAVDPDMADHMGAFEEEALSFEDALDSFFDGEAPTGQETSDGA